MTHRVSLVPSTSARPAHRYPARLTRPGPYVALSRRPGHRSGHNRARCRRSSGPCHPVDSAARPRGRPWTALDATAASLRQALPAAGRVVALQEVVGMAHPILLICPPGRGRSGFQAVAGHASLGWLRCSGVRGRSVTPAHVAPCCRHGCRQRDLRTAAHLPSRLGNVRVIPRRSPPLDGLADARLASALRSWLDLPAPCVRHHRRRSPDNDDGCPLYRTRASTSANLSGIDAMG
jgi:hypothetical protein